MCALSLSLSLWLNSTGTRLWIMRLQTGLFTAIFPFLRLRLEAFWLKELWNDLPSWHVLAPVVTTLFLLFLHRAARGLTVRSSEVCASACANPAGKGKERRTMTMLFFRITPFPFTAVTRDGLSNSNSKQCLFTSP